MRRARRGADFNAKAAATIPLRRIGTVDDVAARVDRVIGRCSPVLVQGGDCLLVAHGHVLRILTARWLGLAPIAGRLFALDPARISALGFEHEQHVIRSWNATAAHP